MKTKNIIFKSNTGDFTSDLPVECPYCSSFTTPRIMESTRLSHDDQHVFLHTLYNDCCDKVSYLLNRKTNIDKTGDLLFLYPNTLTPTSLPSSILTISPRFVNLYKQCYDAEQKGYFELAGSGYRNALEVLIKDYAINELKEPHEKVCKHKLVQAIENYIPNVRIKQSADVIRILGNDYTHYERKYDDIEFPILKQYLHIFIQSIDTEYLIDHPPVKTNRQLSVDPIE